MLDLLLSWLYQPASSDEPAKGLIRSRLKYIKLLPLYTHEKPFICEFDVSKIAGARQTNVEHETREVLIGDIRGREDEFSIERNGFEILPHQSAIYLEQIGLEPEIKEQYKREAEEVLRTRFDAQSASVFSLEVRDNTQDGGHMPRSLTPLQDVHIDQTHAAIVRRAHHHFGDEKATRLLQDHRVLIVNLWRPINGPVRDMPLSVCDTRSVRPDDLIAIDNVALGNYVGEILGVRYNSSHQQYYLSEQTAQEPWLLYMGEHNPKAPNEIAQGVPHAAFPLPTPNGHGVLPRKSVEVRALVVI